MDLSIFSVPDQIISILANYAEHPEEWRGNGEHAEHASGVQIDKLETAYRITLGGDAYYHTLDKGCALGLLFCALRKREITGGGSPYLEMPFNVILEPDSGLEFRTECTSVRSCYPGLAVSLHEGRVKLHNTTRETFSLIEGQPVAKII